MEKDMFYSIEHCKHKTAAANSSRRRTRSTGSLPWGKASGDSSSSIGEWDISKELAMSSIHQSDSDDMSSIHQGNRRSLYNLQPTNRLTRLFPTIESDSVNENFSPIRPTTRRKRKLKRMAVDIEMGSCSTGRISHLPHINTCQSIIGTTSVFGSKKKRILRHGSNCENRLKRNFGWMPRYCSGGRSGKRKRSARSLGDPPRTVLALHRLSLKDDHLHQHSSDSPLSSSESDPGIYTNDEGREGDDEQSDWVWDGGRVGWEDDTPVPNISGPSSVPTSTSRLARYIRGGRRRLRQDKASFTVLTSANEKLSRFLQDPQKSQLRLHPMKEQERHELCHLAELYSLDMSLSNDSAHKGLTCPVLTKTSNTVKSEPISSSGLLVDHQAIVNTTPDSGLLMSTLQVNTPGINSTLLLDNKRRRCTPPNTDSNTQDGMGEVEAMEEDNQVPNKILDSNLDT